MRPPRSIEVASNQPATDENHLLQGLTKPDIGMPWNVGPPARHEPVITGSASQPTPGDQGKFQHWIRRYPWAIIAAVAIVSLGVFAVTRVPQTNSDPVRLTPAAENRSTSGAAFTYCGETGPNISANATISGLSVDFDDPAYCQGFRFTLGYARSNPEICDQFWNLGDAEIVDLYMSPDGGNHTYVNAVGMVDGLWAAC
ncbi:hypothetical protein [Gemmatimonas sp.]|uniref:hypothetical protein n=1 Tax=Gemmatimonas sp. TaxID=1962908 RepID=UPI003569588C